jgi:hypothetical protein
MVQQQVIRFCLNRKAGGDFFNRPNQNQAIRYFMICVIGYLIRRNKNLRFQPKNEDQEEQRTTFQHDR